MRGRKEMDDYISARHGWKAVWVAGAAADLSSSELHVSIAVAAIFSALNAQSAFTAARRVYTPQDRLIHNTALEECAGRRVTPSRRLSAQSVRHRAESSAMFPARFNTVPCTPKLFSRAPVRSSRRCIVFVSAPSLRTSIYASRHHAVSLRIQALKLLSLALALSFIRLL